MKLPKFNSVKKHIEADDMKGWCINCGKWTHDSCEPDAHEYICPKCDKPTVYAAEELLIQNKVIL